MARSSISQAWRNAVLALFSFPIASSLQVPRHAAVPDKFVFGRQDSNLEKEYDEIMADFISHPLCFEEFPGSGGGGGGGKGQQIAVASYISPLADPETWNWLNSYPKSKVPILVANVVNGPDVEVNEPWKKVIDRAAASGKIVIGYVRTGYLGIQRDVDMWYELYGSSMGGIFFDEGWPECGPDNIYAKFYKYINDYTKRAHPGALTVLNPGSPMAHCFEDTMDTLLTFEWGYAEYYNKYTPNDWTPKDPRKLWHIIYDVPESAIGAVAKLARDRGAGYTTAIRGREEAADNKGVRQVENVSIKDDNVGPYEHRGECAY
ncbi:hypothetical protein NM208_g3972 [Fusarium decemcellulare]|uniref:Uncharacterized protein n=1 Tax=Fusarium decemcellulare TaxID=57161 RepID=A0ACC1SMM8_9HYPO|nr:hypothetical protein NM208_g3972 [Fusarium decemcellulare]